MSFIIGIVIAIPVLVVIFLLIKSLQGVRYWNRCEKEYASLVLEGGYSNEEALLEISKERRPDIGEATHAVIVHKFNDIHKLVNFHFNALPDDKKMGDDIVLEILNNTTIECYGKGKYRVRTRWDRVSKK